jgi:hypothetical protein
LLESITKSVVGVADRGRRTEDGGQAIGGIVGIGIYSVIEQVPVGVGSIGFRQFGVGLWQIF